MGGVAKTERSGTGRPTLLEHGMTWTCSGRPRAARPCPKWWVVDFVGRLLDTRVRAASWETENNAERFARLLEAVGEEPNERDPEAIVDVALEVAEEIARKTTRAAADCAQGGRVCVWVAPCSVISRTVRGRATVYWCR